MQFHKGEKCSLLSHVQFFVIAWTITHQAPLFMGFSRQEYWSGLPFPFTGNLPNQGIEPMSLNLLHGQVGSLPPGKDGPQFFVTLGLQLLHSNLCFFVMGPSHLCIQISFFF